MTAPGETDLATMPATLAVERRPGVFTYLTVESVNPELFAAAHATLNEGLACNVLAGYHHDHLLVPVERAGDAIAALTRALE